MMADHMLCTAGQKKKEEEEAAELLPFAQIKALTRSPSIYIIDWQIQGCCIQAPDLHTIPSCARPIQQFRGWFRLVQR